MTENEELSAEKARDDFAKGAMDEVLYAKQTPEGLAYRNAWREARWVAEDKTKAKGPLPPPEPPAGPTEPAVTTQPEPPQADGEALAALGGLEIPPPAPGTPGGAESAPGPSSSPTSEPEQEVRLPEPEGQLSLLDVAPDWAEHWKGMPEFTQRDLEPWATLPVHFKSRADRDDFAALINQTITDDTRSVWFPRAEIGRYVDRRFSTECKIDPRYPVYVISKGRPDTRLTSRALEAIRVPYRIVVEPQERDAYAAVIDPAKILVLPFSNLGQGSIPARNWVWEHAVAAGAERHWILDDNISGFYRLHENLKTPVNTGATFRAIEDFVDRYDNIGLAGMQYFMFASRKSGRIQPFTLNTRIYSCILINHKLDLGERWRGRYNEDTDLSIRALKAGWATVLFNAFLAYKMTTMTMKGGNTDELYKDDGRLKMAQSLVDQHPDCVTVSWKFNRHQHHVDYRLWQDNPLKPKAGVEVASEANNYGMALEMKDSPYRKLGATG